jgi:hypothetical protein
MIEPRLLSPSLAATYCGLPRGEFRSFVGEQGIEPVQIGKSSLFDKVDLDGAIDIITGKASQIDVRALTKNR